MTLTKVSEAEASSTEGFRVKFGRDLLTYLEPGKRTVFDVDHVNAPYHMHVYPNRTPKWLVGASEGEAVDPAGLARIVKRVSESRARAIA